MRALALALALLWGAPAQAALYALVIGIDDYQFIPKLKGAVNDAQGIADALRALQPAELRVLLNGEATRAAVIAAWSALAAKAGPGDTLIVTYAGHGGSEPAAFPATEEDGRDENLMFAGFRPLGPAAGERLRDDEIAGLFALSPQATLIFVADSCHSGTVTRGAKPEHGYRLYKSGEIVDDPLPRLAAPVPETVDPNTPHIFFGAVPESEKVAEYTIDNRVHGAVSYSFAQALRGGGDENGDGVITKGELEHNIRQFVYRRTDGQQSPQVSPSGQTDLAVISLAKAVNITPAFASPFAATFDALPPVPLEILGAAEPDQAIRGLDGAVATPSPGERLVWDVAARELRSDIGDVLLALPAGDATDQQIAVQAAIDKMRVVRALRAASIGQPLTLDFTTGTAIYPKDAEIALKLSHRVYDRAVLFNLAADGQIANLYPTQPGDTAVTPIAQDIGFSLYAAPPFGADHLVAVETPFDVPGLTRSLSQYDGTGNIRALWADLHSALQGQAVAVALFPFFTAAPGQTH